MTCHRVCFYKNLLSSDGHPFRCLQAQFDVPDSESEAQAAEVACKIFESAYGVRDWRLHADAIEVVCTGAQPRPRIRNENDRRPRSPLKNKVPGPFGPSEKPTSFVMKIVSPEAAAAGDSTPK